MLAICFAELREAACILRVIARCAYLITMGCMTAQVNVELDLPTDQYAAPLTETIERV
jgi:hypothetical protein